MGTELPFSVMLITDWGLDDLLDRVDAALGAGGVAVQHRHPGVIDRTFFEEGQRLKAVCDRHGAPLFVNGRLDVALALDAHLHLPSRALRLEDVRPHAGSRWISVAVHDEAEARAAQGASLALVSPVFPPGSKPTDMRPPLGVEGFRKLAALCGCPAFALGGMTPERAREVNADGVAVIGAISRADDPRAAAADLRATPRTAPRP